MARTSDTTLRALRALERLRTVFQGDAAARKLGFLDVLDRGRLRSAEHVRRLHAMLLFLRACPDDQAVLERVQALLTSFHTRRDLARFRSELEDSGISGCDIVYSFYAPMARWLAARHPRALHVDWSGFENASRLGNWLYALGLPQEGPAFGDGQPDVRRWLQRLKGPGESEATFVIRRFAALSRDAATRDVMYEDLDLPVRVAGSADTPSRTRAAFSTSPVMFQRTPLRMARPDLRMLIARAQVRVRDASGAEARELIDMAREAMVTRARHLDSFAYADPADVRIVDCGGGLQFACMGLEPEQRCLLEALYAFLTLRNGVPTGYVMASAFCGSSEVAYNVFEEFRGAEAGHVYGLALATIRRLLGTRVFTVFPYQLGHGNDEALDSGAWWFYQKLGFRPQDREAKALMRRELAAMRGRPGHRTTRRDLARLARSNLYWPISALRPDSIGVFSIPRIAGHVSELLSRRFGSDRKRADRECASEAAELLGVTGWSRWPSAERLAFRRFAPLVLLLPGLDRWPRAARDDLVAVIRAKGAPRETACVPLLARHRRLRHALVTLAARDPTEA